MKRTEVRVVAVEGDCDLLSGCHIYNNKITSLPQHPKHFFRKPAILLLQSVHLLDWIGFFSHAKKGQTTEICTSLYKDNIYPK